MTFSDLVSFARKRKGTVASVALHLLVVGWGLFSFSARSMVVPPEDLVPVDIVSEDNVPKAKLGSKDGKKENPKPLVDKIAEPKPSEDIVGKVDPKPVTETDAAPTPLPKPEKPVEKKPDPPKPVEKKPDPPKPPVVEKKPDPPKPVAQDKPKPEEKKPDAFNPDQIASMLNKEKAKQPPKPQAEAAQPEPPKHKSERKFDYEKIAAAINQKDPTRQSITGTELNANAALGTSRGRAADNSASWGGLFRSQVDRCWKPPFAGVDEKPVVVFNIRLRRDGTLDGPPVPVSAANTPFLRAYQDSALRAIVACQPYNLPAQFFGEWNYFQPAFNADDRQT